jgi:hypothetical protein
VRARQTPMEFSTPSVAPGQRQLSWTEQLKEYYDRKLCGISDWMVCHGLSALACCGSGTDWECVDRERGFCRSVELERGVVYGDGDTSNLELALRYHRTEVGYALRESTSADIADPNEDGEDEGPLPPMAIVVATANQVQHELASETLAMATPVNPSNQRNTRWRNLRRQRFALSPGIVVALADELTVKVGRMCATCKHHTISEVQHLCPANYRAAEFAYLNIAATHGLHPQHVRLYLEPTLMEYFSDRGSGVGFGGYQGLLSNAERRRGTGGGRH